MVTWVIIGIIVVLALALIFIYNSLVRSRVRVEEAWSDITVQMKRRFDLIPNLINTVKGYAKHEREVLQNVTDARANALKSQTVGETAQKENIFQEALKSLFAVAENYPDLKADQNFKHLQEELVDTEDKIQAARRFYNGSVRDLNTKIQTFPTSLIAGLLGFANREFFDVDGAESEVVGKPVEVDFENPKTNSGTTTTKK
jgi:LemA protein